MTLERRQERRDTAANWASNNPTLADGEIGVDTTNRFIKIGDGSTAWNSLQLFGVSGMLLPCQGATDGSETYTISGGNVTQINGTAVTGYSPPVGARILVITAPAASGAGSRFSTTNQPANGVYVVTGNTTNLTVTRAPDMFGAINPCGLSVYIENGNWIGGAIFTVTSKATSWTYGTTAMQWGGTGGADPQLESIFLGNSTNSIGIWNGANSVYLQPTASGNATVLTLPNTATSDTIVARNSTDVLTHKDLSSSTNTFLPAPWCPEMVCTSNGITVADGYNDMPGGIAVEPGINAAGITLDSVWLRVGDLSTVNSGGDLVCDVYVGTKNTQGSIAVSVTLTNGSQDVIGTLGTTLPVAANAVVRALFTKGSSTVAKPLHLQLRGRYLQ